MKPTKIMVNRDCIQFSKLGRVQYFKGNILTLDSHPKEMQQIFKDKGTMDRDPTSGADYLILDFETCADYKCKDKLCDASCSPAPAHFAEEVQADGSLEALALEEAYFTEHGDKNYTYETLEEPLAKGFSKKSKAQTKFDK